MNPAPAAAPSPQPWMQPMLPPNPPPSSAFWDTKTVQNQLRELQDTLTLAKAMRREVELLMAIKDTEEPLDSNSRAFSKYLEDRGIVLKTQESVSLEAANSLMSRLRAQLEPFMSIVDETIPWEEKSAAVRLADKVLKSKRNKLWRKRKRRRIAEMRTKERERFEEADREADEWIAKEIAKDAAQEKVGKMKQIAKIIAKEERKRLESELELALIVEKLQELRSMRIQKLKKQGHFLPEEDNKFLERVRAAVEEEERQAAAAAGTDAAKDAIATAEESRKTIQTFEESNDDSGGIKNSGEQLTESLESAAVIRPFEDKGSKGQSKDGTYDSVANLPIEFYHYYHGSNNDMGTLIEVRRTWDAYIRPGGSRIPGHWVQAPPPADDIWASYLIRPQ